MMLILSLAASLGGSPYDFSTRRDRPLAESIVFELQTDKSTYIVGEAVELRFVGRNKSGSLFHGPLITPLDIWTRVKVKRGGAPGRELRLSPRSNAGDVEMRKCKLAPKESFSERGTFVFDYAANSLILDEPGTYEFKAKYSDNPGNPAATVESNVWTVEVEPPPDRHRDAFEAYRKLDAASLATWPTYFFKDLTSEEAVAALDFLERFPESPWAKQVRRGLVPTVETHLLHGKASEEEVQRFRMLREREAAEQQAGP